MIIGPGVLSKAGLLCSMRTGFGLGMTSSSVSDVSEQENAGNRSDVRGSPRRATRVVFDDLYLISLISKPKSSRFGSA